VNSAGKLGKASHATHLALDTVVSLFASLNVAAFLFLLTARYLLGVTTTTDWRAYAVIVLFLAISEGYLLRFRALGATKTASILVVTSAVVFFGTVFFVAFFFSLLSDA
jgi:hypothetical protein